MKAIQVSIAAAVVLSFVTWNVSAGLFSISVKGTEYSDSGVFKLSNATFIQDCGVSNATQLAAVVDDINSNITALVTVDACGTVLCTNLIATVCSSQTAATGPGKGVAAAILTVNSPDSNTTGQAFAFVSATVSNETSVVSLKGKGNLTLCSTFGAVVNGTFSISGPFKRGKNCDQ